LIIRSVDVANHRAEIAIVGAGITGLAHATLAARRGHSVVVFERGVKASGASIRNFGQIWAIKEPQELIQVAVRSRDLWLEVLEQARIPFFPTGSLLLTYRDDEAAVGKEFAELAPPLGYECRWLAREEVLNKSHAVIAEGLQGAVWGPKEFSVDPRWVSGRLPDFLTEQFGVQFRFGCAVHSVSLPSVEAGTERWTVDQAIICSGDDFASLYPGLFVHSGITRCKLQMLRTVPQAEAWRLGPSLAAGLTLRFYPAFRICTQLPALEKRIARETPEYNEWGIHGLVSQTVQGELTLGDSHEYGLAVDIFDKTKVDELILRYIRTFLRAPDWTIAQRWHGVYAKHPEKPFVSFCPEQGVRVVTAVGGSGMTLSFGLAERTLEEMGI
jgi:D-hydroxyproline dehydrogenase subunit beta